MEFPQTNRSFIWLIWKGFLLQVEESHLFTTLFGFLSLIDNDINLVNKMFSRMKN